MFGLAYWRELLLRDRQQNTTHRMDHKYVDDLSKNLLNKWAATVATNDLFLPGTPTYLEEEYHLDRGIALNKALMQIQEDT